MSACISRHGEFSNHQPDSDYVCHRCGQLDEDGLIAELTKLRAEVGRTPAPARYRGVGVPAEHAQEWVEVQHLGNRIEVRRADDSPPWKTAILPVDWLEPIRPPSIDDPATQLPLELHYEHDSGRGANSRSTSLWLKEDDAGWTLAQIYEFGPESYSAPVRLNVGQLRALARAAWQRAKAIGGAS